MIPSYDAGSSSSTAFIREPTPEAKIITKQKLKPSVTPRTFRRFFTPRKANREGIRKKDRSALVELTPSGINSRKRIARGKLTATLIEDVTPSSSPNTSIWEQTKSSPVWSITDSDASPSKRQKTQHISTIDELEFSESDDDDVNIESPPLLQPIRRSNYRLPLGDCLRRQLSLSVTPQSKSTFYAEAYYESSRYYSKPDDVFNCRSISNERPRAVVPFCSAACNTNSLVAVGDEDGVIRILETGRNGVCDFRKPWLSVKAHNNALLDLQFSDDDKLLATAPRDQGGQIIDMIHQKAKSVLRGHTSSVKQIKFQPGSNDSVVATSSRDGSIRIWDLRCWSRTDQLNRVTVSLNGNEEDRSATLSNSEAVYPYPRNLIDDAHYTSLLLPPPTSNSSQGKNTDRRTQPLQSRSEPSVTALSFLSASNPHILLSGADSQASIKVWDIRMTQSHRHTATPISTTTLPARHNRYRHFGLTSMALSSDSSRLYTLCKDNTVYVYSTSHLTLGSSQQTYDEKIRTRRSSPEKTGLGPIYGFRHPKISVSSFYVKLALRPARDDVSEMLAVGSSNACAVLFPTDERTFRASKQNLPIESSPRDKWQLSRNETEVPIYSHGTALVSGHEKEVTDVSWTSDGNLLTLGDDTRCRVWRSDGDFARDLRRGGEQEGRRWGHGWAEMDDQEWDDSD